MYLQKVGNKQKKLCSKISFLKVNDENSSIRIQIH
jgi:hypothetical protein